MSEPKQTFPDDWTDYGDDGDCWNCGGDGYVFDCIDGCCEDAESGCDLCTKRCEVCNPRTAITPKEDTNAGK